MEQYDIPKVNSIKRILLVFINKYKQSAGQLPGALLLINAPKLKMPSYKCFHRSITRHAQFSI